MLGNRCARRVVYAEPNLILFAHLNCKLMNVWSALRTQTHTWDASGNEWAPLKLRQLRLFEKCLDTALFRR